MANLEACQVYIEQQIDEGLSSGKSRRAIGKELAEQVAKLFEAKIPADTIRKRAERRAAKLGPVTDLDKCPPLSPLDKAAERLIAAAIRRAKTDRQDAIAAIDMLIDHLKYVAESLEAE